MSQKPLEQGKRTVAKGLRKVLKYVAPATRIINQATSIAVQLAKPTPLGIINMVSNGLSTLNYELERSDALPKPGGLTGRQIYSRNGIVPTSVMEAALLVMGYERVQTKDAANQTRYLKDEHVWLVTDDSYIAYIGLSPPEELGLMEEMRRAIDPLMSPTVAISQDEHGYVTRTMGLTSLTPSQTTEIGDRTKALLADHRCIMLNGRPGVGKSTLAQAIARDLKLGRTVWIDHDAFSSMSLEEAKSLSLMSVGTVILDDIDKVGVFRLDTFEAIRNSVRLLIVTANNGEYDRVIDGALARPGRIDEDFTVKAKHPFRAAPFGVLTDAQWDEISQWPQAYMNELALRLIHTPNDLRMDELAAKLGRKTRSGAFMPEDD